MEVVKTGHELIDKLIEATQGCSTWYFDYYNLFSEFKVFNDRVHFAGIHGCYHGEKFHATFADGELKFLKGDISMLQNAFELYMKRNESKSTRSVFAWTMMYERLGHVQMSEINTIIDQLNKWACSGDFPKEHVPKYYVSDYGSSPTIKLITVTCPKYTISLNGLSLGHLSFGLNPTKDTPKQTNYTFTSNSMYGTVVVPGSPYLDWASCIVTEPDCDRGRHATSKDAAFVVDTINGKF